LNVDLLVFLSFQLFLSMKIPILSIRPGGTTAEAARTAIGGVEEKTRELEADQ